MDRKNFLLHSATAGTALLIHPFPNFAQVKSKQTDPYNPEIVKEFVGVCHGKFDRAKEPQKGQRNAGRLSQSFILPSRFRKR